MTVTRRQLCRQHMPQLPMACLARAERLNGCATFLPKQEERQSKFPELRSSVRSGGNLAIALAERHFELAQQGSFGDFRRLAKLG